RFNSRIASPAPLRFASRISEYLRDRITPSAPAWKAPSTAPFTLGGVPLLLSGPVGISISMPGQIRDADGHNALHGKAGSALRGKTGLFVFS
ncbi:MAG TPA: hypothetical protein VNO32_57435, partial [Candidatus Acidoferrum sp.]|nr:hypothetical protein [Candidatus Acidoferrum sp.]